MAVLGNDKVGCGGRTGGSLLEDLCEPLERDGFVRRLRHGRCVMCRVVQENAGLDLLVPAVPDKRTTIYDK